MRSWKKIAIRVAVGGAAMIVVPGAVGAQQAQTPAQLPADTGAVRIAPADTGVARKPAIADSVTAAKAVVADTGVARKPAIADSITAAKAVVADTGFAMKAAVADSGVAMEAVVADTGTVRKAAVADTGTARRAAPDSALVATPHEPTEPGLVKRPNPLGQFTKSQTGYERVLAARIEKRFEIKKLYRDRGIEYPAAEVFVRIFKRERELELWVRPTDAEQFSLLKTYSICALAGELGPKRTEGDGQTPEGFYFIDDFNPTSDFHLSLHLDYPNRADRALWKSPNPGGQIFIHGGCNSAGCLAVTDDAIKEIYWIAVEARSAGQRRIPVHIFPTRLTDNALAQLVRYYEAQPELGRFWSNLKTGFDYFENNRTVPSFSVADAGRYALKNQVLGVPVAGDQPRGGLLGQPLARDSASRAPLSSKPIVSDTTRRGGD